MPSRTLVCVTSAAAIGLVAAANIAAPRDLLLYNHSPSVPPGFYLRKNAEPEVGALVTVRARDVAPDYAHLRQFADDGDRFIKRVVARNGDKVCAVDKAITINGRTVAHRALRDSAGRLLPQWLGCHVMRDEVFLLGDTQDSFDGRYFGPVRENLIEGVWRFVF